MPDNTAQVIASDGGASLLERAGMMAHEEPAKPNGKTAAGEFKRYLIVTANPGYSGKSFGVQINKGIGILDETSVDHKLGFTIQDIVDGLRDMGGYSITDLEGKDVVTAIQSVRQQQDAQEAAAINTIRALAGLGADRVMELIAAARQG
jgi:hypothetical protein